MAGRELSKSRGPSASCPPTPSHQQPLGGPPPVQLAWQRLGNADVPAGVVGKARKAAAALSEAADATEVDDAPTAARLLRTRCG